jgi:glycosyltransferase involved in cell wall biosynthesis
MSKTSVSIIICCYNSEHLIQKTLEHIASQETHNAFIYEVVLVDNNCSDQTVNMAKHFWHKLDIRAMLHVVTELQPGLSYARKRGVQASKGDLVVFCDDDNWLQNDYLQIAYDFMKEHPKVGALGGQSIGVLECAAPEWWDIKKTSYAVGEQSIHSGDISTRGYLWGAGLVIRKEILLNLQKVNFTSLLSDRKGKELNSGGDSEMCKWVLLSGYQLWYLNELEFSHYITANRLEDTYLEKLFEGHSKAQSILNLYDRFIVHVKGNEGIRSSILQDFQILKKGVKYFFEKDKRWKEYIQLALGSRFKFYPDLFIIIRTLKKIKNL